MFWSPRSRSNTRPSWRSRTAPIRARPRRSRRRFQTSARSELETSLNRCVSRFCAPQLAGPLDLVVLCCPFARFVSTARVEVRPLAPIKFPVEATATGSPLSCASRKRRGLSSFCVRPSARAQPVLDRVSQCLCVAVVALPSSPLSPSSHISVLPNPSPSSRGPKG